MTASELGLTVVAEGVETQAELAFLRSIECNQAQERLIGGAMSCTDFETLLLEDRSSKPRKQEAIGYLSRG